MAAISKSARVCETCGSPIETTSAGDLGCIACLIATGLDAEAEQSDAAFALAPDKLGAYTIEHHVDGSAWELGHGAMGVTYRAIDKALDRPVALKIINTDRRSHSAEARQRFMREARAAGALRHPNVATVYQFGVREETGQFFYAMELVEGETLEERVRRLGPLDVLTTIDIALQVTAALEAAAERGLVHRDLKPGNLMLVSPNDETPRASTQRGGYSDPRGVGATAEPARRGGRRRAGRNARGTDQANQELVVKVIDFGVAKAVTEKTNAMALTHGGFIGTPAFASPEQFTNAPVDVRSDIYSLGVTLWFLLTGHMLFSGRTIEEIRDARRSKPLPIEQLEAAHVPRRFVSLLVSMLAIEPAARPAGARELSARLQAIRASITGRGKTAARVAVAAAIVALAIIVGVRQFHSTKATPSVIPEKSIAVLPFENPSPDPNHAYLAEGMQEEIIRRLTGIRDLKVTSRTSTRPYQSKPRDLSQIAKQLGVANILEGSVQRAGDRVRVNVQLINAHTDSRLWAKTFNSKLIDMLQIEGEIAQGIAESVQAKLTGREKQALAVTATNNPEAYEAYLRGLGFEPSNYLRLYQGNYETKAASFYEQAVQLDPNFATAWARLSRAEARIVTRASARGDASKRALENAQKLAPNSPETLLAMACYQYWVLRDYGTAEATFGRVSKILPGNSEVLATLSRITRRQERWDEGIAYSEQAIALDPRNVKLLMDAAITYAELRQFPKALKLYDRALDITLTDQDVMAGKAVIYQAQGNLREAARFLSEINWQTRNGNTFRVKIRQLTLERNYDDAARLLQARLARFNFGGRGRAEWHWADSEDNDSEDNERDNQLLLALTQRLAGDANRARVTAQQASSTLARLYQDQPNDRYLAMTLSQAYAVMGEKDVAVKVAERALILGRASDPVSARMAQENMAMILTMVGENNRAISLLTELSQVPYWSYRYGPSAVTRVLLRLDPLWDPLRGDPAFQKLCEEKQASWDLGLDFSDSANPNGQWSYNAGDNPLPTYWPNWGWAFATPKNFHHIPMWNNAKDVGPDVVRCHSTDDSSGLGYDLANVTWTSPIAGNVYLEFATWFANPDSPFFHEGRSNTWRIYHGKELLASGMVGDKYPFNRANPARYSAMLSVEVGDVIRLEAEQYESSPYGTFQAFRLKLSSNSATPTPVSEITVR